MVMTTSDTAACPPAPVVQPAKTGTDQDWLDHGWAGFAESLGKVWLAQPWQALLQSPDQLPLASNGALPVPHHWNPNEEGPSGHEQYRETLDRLIHASIGRVTRSLSPTALAMAYFNWASHLTFSPGKQQTLMENGFKNWMRFLLYASRAVVDPDTPECITPLPQDHRFSDPAWRLPPFNLLYQSHLLAQAWWHRATTGIHGVSRHHSQLLTFLLRQQLDLLSPSNTVITNPVVLRTTINTGGANVLRGINNWFADTVASFNNQPPPGADAFRPGETVAITPGQVVMRNRLVELIQYSPSTPQVFAEPILIIPAWIMKYYILDLSPNNSLIKYLVDRGHTVFTVSWRNPDASDRDLGMDDYLEMGVIEAIQAVKAIVPGQKIHAAGYCLGGTLLSIATALLSREGDESLKSMTMFAAQTDFTEAGELTLFIDESQISMLEDVMWSQGYLDTRQMAGAFQLLRSNDLVWSRLVNDYMMGERQRITDIMAWNADSTRMPYRMHSEYLRHLFLDNDLIEGRFKVRGHAVALTDIHIPVFAVATESDHVAPWRSVYKIHLLPEIDITFVLTNGGHNAGIVSEPGHRGRHFRMSMRPTNAPMLDPQTWQGTHPPQDGSWWPVWAEWLEKGQTRTVAPPAMGTRENPPLGAAPGTYVLQE